MAEKVPAVRRIGLVASLAAVVALTVTVIAGNRDAGLRAVSQAGQLTLLAVSLLFCLIQIGLYVISRRKNRGIR